MTTAAETATTVPTRIDFAQGGNSAGVRGVGWSTQEPDFVWSLGEASTLILPAWPHREDLLLDLLVTRPEGGQITANQVLVIRMQGQVLGRFVVTGLSQVRCRIGAALLQHAAPIELRFEHPCFAAMHETGQGTDRRPLAICFFRLQLGPAARSLDPDWAPEAARTDIRSTRPTTLSQTFVFARDGNATSGLRGGWLCTEDGEAMTAAPASHLVLPALDLPRHCVLLMRLSPVIIHALRPAQRLTVLVAGCVVGQVSLAHETEIALPMPDELAAEAAVLPVTLICPDAIRLQDFASGSPGMPAFTLDRITLVSAPAHLPWPRRADTPARRPLATSADFLDDDLQSLPRTIEAVLGVTPAELLCYCESLGNNCAFGIAQRKAGAQSLGLLRFANTPIAGLFDALADEFAEIADPAGIALTRATTGAPREFILCAHRSAIRWHTGLHEGEASVAQAGTEQIARLHYLRRRFLAGLRTRRRIYVHGNFDPRKIPIAAPAPDAPDHFEEAMAPVSLAEATALAIRLNRFGRNTLLYVVPCAEGQRSGSAELLMPGLIKGYLASFVISADLDVHDHADWLRLCANAWTLDQLEETSDERA